MRGSELGLSVRPVAGSRDWALFERLPEHLFSGHAAFVPPFPGSVAGLGKKTHPFLRHGSVIPYLAFRGSEPVGRVAAVVNRTHNAYHGDRTGFVGFFDCAEDPAAAEALLGAAEAELAGRGHPLLRGPFSPTQNDPCGVLVEGFQHRPALLMPWNPPYYASLWEGAGWTAVRDLYGYRLDSATSSVGSRLHPVVERMQRRSRVRVRSGSRKRFRRDLAIIHRLFNETLGDEWNFMPLGAADLEAWAKPLKWILDRDLVLIAEDGEDPVGFCLSIPDVHEAWARAARAPRVLRWPALAWALARRRPRSFRIVALGVLAGHRVPGLTALLFERTHAAGVGRYDFAEISWVQDHNHEMHGLMRQIEAERFKTYRIYEKRVGDA